MEIAGSYDVLNGCYSQITHFYTASDEEDEEDHEVEFFKGQLKVKPPGSFLTNKLKNIFTRNNLSTQHSRKRTQNPTIPHSYWEISSAEQTKTQNLQCLQSKQQFVKSAECLTGLTTSDQLDKQNTSPDTVTLTFDTETLVQDDCEKTQTKTTKTEELTQHTFSRMKKIKVAVVKQLKSFVHTKPNIVDIKILVMGNASVGKSSIIRRFVYGIFEFSDDTQSHGYDTKLMKFQNNNQFCLHVFEINGNNVSSAIISSTCVSNVLGAVFVIDINNTQSLRSIQKWKFDLDAKAKFMKIGKIPCVLMVNKCDSSNETDITFDMCQLDTFCTNNGIAAWFDTSAKDDFNIKNAFVYLMQTIVTELRGGKHFNVLDKNVEEKKKNRMLHSINFTKSFKKRNKLIDGEYSTML